MVNKVISARNEDSRRDVMVAQISVRKVTGSLTDDDDECGGNIRPIVSRAGVSLVYSSH
jgi:hypothetical protein